jgi:predicted nucleotidyltransferase
LSDIKELQVFLRGLFPEGFLVAYPSISSLYLSGSLARGDFVEGFSDIDLVAIGKKIDDREIRKLRTWVNKELEEYELEVSIKPYNISDIEKDKVEAYLISQDSQLLVGEDILSRISKPDREDIVSYGTRVLDRQIDDWIRHSDEEIPYSIDEVSGSIYMVLRLAQSYLLTMGVICYGSKQIYSEFSSQVMDEELVSFVREALELKTSWNLVQADRERLESFYRKAIRFAYHLRDRN